MTGSSRISNRTITSLIGATALISLVVGLVLYEMADMGASIILWAVLMITGAAIAISAPFRTGSVKSFGPSDSDYYLVWGILMFVIGLIGYTYVFSNLGWLAPVSIIILTIAILGIVLTLKNNKMRSG